MSTDGLFCRHCGNTVLKMHHLEVWATEVARAPDDAEWWIQCHRCGATGPREASPEMAANQFCKTIRMREQARREVKEEVVY